MMYKNVFLLLSILVLLGCGLAQAQPAAPVMPPQTYEQLRGHVFNVRDFGAVGDSATNDSAAFNKTIDAMSAGDVLYVPPGKYYVSDDSLVFPKNCGMFGVGHSSKIYMPAENADIVFDSGGWASNFFLYPDDTSGIALDTNAIGPRLLFQKLPSGGWQEGVHISRIYGWCAIQVQTGYGAIVKDCEFEGPGYDGVGSGIIFTACENSFITNNYVFRAGHNEIMLHRCRGVQVINNILEGDTSSGASYAPGHSGIIVSSGNPHPPTGGYNILIEGNEIFGHGVHDGIDINPLHDYDDSLGITIHNNTIYDNESPGIIVNGAGVTITNNTIHNNNQEGIRFAPISGAGDDEMVSRHNVITNNILYDNAQADDGDDYNIRLFAQSQTLIAGNYMYFTKSKVTGMDGHINLSDSCVDMTITGNMFWADTISGGPFSAGDDMITGEDLGHPTYTSPWDSVRIYGNTGRYYQRDSIYFSLPLVYPNQSSGGGGADADSIKGVAVQDTSGNWADNYIMKLNFGNSPPTWDLEPDVAGSGAGYWDSSIVKVDSIVIQLGNPYDTAIQIIHDTTGYAAGTDSTHLESPDGALLFHGTADTAALAKDVDATGTIDINDFGIAAPGKIIQGTGEFLDFSADTIGWGDDNLAVFYMRLHGDASDGYMTGYNAGFIIDGLATWNGVPIAGAYVDDVMDFDTLRVGVSPPDAAVLNATTTQPGYFMKEPDAHFGNATAGMIEIGNAVIAEGARDTTYNNDSLDLGGAMVFRQTVEPDGPFEFVFYENGGELRFVIPKSGDSLGTWNSRSMLIAGPERMIDSVVRFNFWGFTKIACNTDVTGADLGVQNDAEVMGKVYLDTLDNITAAPIEVLGDFAMNDNNILGADTVATAVLTASDSVVTPKVITTGITTGIYKAISTSGGSTSWTIDDSTTANYPYVFPMSFGTAGQQLADLAGDGILRWATPAFADSTGAAVASDIVMDTLGAPTFSTVQEMQNIFHSAGYIAGGELTDGPDGGGNVDTVLIAAGDGFIRAANLAVDTNGILFFDWSAARLEIPDDTVLMFGVKYNSGNPIVFDTTADKSIFDHQQNFELGTVTNEGGVLHITLNPHTIGDHATNMIERTQGTMGIQRDRDIGGIILNETGTRNPTVSAGALHSKLNVFSISAIDLSSSGSMDRYYQDGSGGWTKQASQTQWNNTQYDDGDGGLATINNNRYSNQYFYIELDGALISLYGQGEYVSLAGADAETVPATVPKRLTVNQGILIGRIIFQESAATASAIQTVFTTTFSGTLVSDHGNLGGLQGGTAAEYYHLTSAEYSALGTHTLDSAEVMTIVRDSTIQHIRFNLAFPSLLQAADAEWCLIPLTDSAITIAAIDVTLDADPTTEIEFSIKYADAFIGQANTVVIDDTATVAGVTAVIAGFGDATVPKNKCIFFVFDSAPDAATTQMSVDISYKED